MTSTYAIDRILMGKETTFHIKNISTGDVIVRTATEAAQDVDEIRGMSPEDACLVGMWFGKDQSKSADEGLVQVHMQYAVSLPALQSFRAAVFPSGSQNRGIADTTNAAHSLPADPQSGRRGDMERNEHGKC